MNSGNWTVLDHFKLDEWRKVRGRVISKRTGGGKIGMRGSERKKSAQKSLLRPKLILLSLIQYHHTIQRKITISMGYSEHPQSDHV